MTRTSSIAAVAAPTITLRYDLAELPSAQHRAGLAGLKLMIDWLKRQGDHPGLVAAEIDRNGMTLKMNEPGLSALLDLIYDAKLGEVAVSTPWKDTDPLRVEEQTEIDPKTQKPKIKKLYVYPKVMPRGAFLEDFEQGQEQPWLSLWQDFIWQVMRGKPKSRLPYDNRAHGKPSGQAEKLWKGLSKAAMGQAVQVNLAGSLYLGAQDRTGDNVEYLDKLGWQFLLHTWIVTFKIGPPRSSNVRAPRRGYSGAGSMKRPALVLSGLQQGPGSGRDMPAHPSPWLRMTSSSTVRSMTRASRQAAVISE